MTLWLLLFVLGQPDSDECQDRRPGLSKCVEYNAKTVDKGVVVEWTCKAACYSPKKPGRGNDGGTDASLVYGVGKDKPACLEELRGKCRP